MFFLLYVSFLAIVVFPAPDGEEITISKPFFFTCNRNYLADFSTNLIASPTVNIFSASLSEISAPNSSSKAITNSTVSKLSAPKSSIKLASSVTFAASTPK